MQWLSEQAGGAYEQQTEYEDLSGRLDRLEAVAEGVDHGYDADPYSYDEPDLQAIAEATRQEVFSRAGLFPQQAQQPQQAAQFVVESAVELASAELPGFVDSASEVQQYMQRHSIDISSAVASGDPRNVANLLESVYVRVQHDRETRLSKQQAQTITGASQRPETMSEGDAYWQSVKATPVGTVRIGAL